MIVIGVTNQTQFRRRQTPEPTKTVIKHERRRKLFIDENIKRKSEGLATNSFLYKTDYPMDYPINVHPTI